MEEKSNRVSVAQAAKELGLAECSVRIWMESGQLPIGRCIKRKGGRRATYLIYRDLLDKELGKDETNGERNSGN